MKKIIILPWDGVFIDTLPALHQSYLAAFRAVGDKRAETWNIITDTAERRGIYPKHNFKEVFGDNYEAAREAFYSTYDKEAKNLPLREGSLEFFEKAAIEYSLIVISAKGHSILAGEIWRTGVHLHLYHHVGSVGNPIWDKPHQGVVFRAIEGIEEIIPEEILMIGKKKDALIAKAAGIEFFPVCGDDDVIANIANKLGI